MGSSFGPDAVNFQLLQRGTGGMRVCGRFLCPGFLEFTLDKDLGAMLE